MVIIRFLPDGKVEKKFKDYQWNFFDGQVSLMILASGSLFLVFMILIIILNGFWLNFNYNIEARYIKWYYYIIFFDIFFLIIILVVNVTLLYQIKKSIKVLHRNEVTHNIFRNSFISSLITISLLEFSLWFTVKNIQNSDLLYLVITIIFLSCWAVLFIFIKKYLNISRENIKNFVTVCLLIIILTPLIIFTMQNVFLFIMNSNDLTLAYNSSFIWILSFAFGSMLIGFIELFGINKQVIHQYGNKKLFFKPSTDFFLLFSLPILLLPINVMKKFNVLYENYFDKITMVIQFSFLLILIFLIISFVLRKLNEKIYYKSNIKQKTMIGDILKDKRPISLFITYLIIILIVSSFIQSNFVPTYEKDISKIFSNQNEYEIIKKSENYNYGIYWNISLFDDGSIDNNNLPSYSNYIWLNFINSTAVDFCSNKIDYLECNNIRTIAYFRYINKIYSSGTYHIDFNINHSKNNLKIYLKENTIIEKELLFHYIYTKDMKYPSSDTNVNDIDGLINYHYTFNNSYLVYMELYYEEYYGQLAGFENDIFQIVIFDKELNLKLIIVKPIHRIS